MRRFMIIIRLFLVCVIFSQMGSMAVFAQMVSPYEGGTILPETIETVADCKAFMNYVNANADYVKEALFEKEDSNFIEIEGSKNIWFLEDVLGCGIKTGQMRLWMIPYYIRYVLEFVVGLAGLVAVGGIVYGGYLYLFAGISDEKDKGKSAIKYGVIGLIMTLLAWAFVNIVIALVTS